MQAVTITDDTLESKLEVLMSARHSAYQQAKSHKFGANHYTSAWRAANRAYVEAKDASK